MSTERPYTPTALDIRIHALNVAASTRRDVFPPREGTPDQLADQILSDAKKYAEWVENGDK